MWFFLIMNYLYYPLIKLEYHFAVLKLRGL